MRITVHGKHIETGEALRTRVRERLEASVGKFLDIPGEATVTVSRDGPAFRTDFSLHLSSGLTAHAHATAHEVHASVDAALDRIEKQLRRYKGRLKDHHKRAAHAPMAREAAQSFILAPDKDDADEAPGANVNDEQSLIIAETQIDIKTLGVREAVMQMELVEECALLFRNGASGHLNMVYRRSDGNIGWIDTKS